MDSKHKIVLAVVAGALGGMLLLGSALAIPVALHSIARVAVGDGEYGYGMMGQRGGMMGRGQAPRWEQGPNSAPEFDDRGPRGFGPNGGCGAYGPQEGRGMYGPQGGAGVCPNFDTQGTAL